MSEQAIEIRDLRVDYGDFVAVRDISLSVPCGEVFGLVGPNGAGKTSTFKVLTTLMEPTYGEVSIAGLDIFEQAEEAREVMGYMPDLAPVPSDLKLWEFLDFHANTHRLGNGKERRAHVDECLELVNLLDKSDSWCKELSRGQTQRLVLAKTLLHRPKVLILDEPASGLDPLSRREMRIIFQDLARQGSTIIVSSHILSELARRRRRADAREEPGPVRLVLGLQRGPAGRDGLLPERGAADGLQRAAGDVVRRRRERRLRLRRRRHDVRL